MISLILIYRGPDAAAPATPRAELALVLQDDEAGEHSVHETQLLRRVTREVERRSV